MLTAVEHATSEAGADALELNVFGGNAAAIELYSSSGYAVVTQQMRKPLGQLTDRVCHRCDSRGRAKLSAGMFALSDIMCIIGV